MQEVGGENLFKKALKLSGSGLDITIHPLSQTEIINNSTSWRKLSWQQSHSPEVPLCRCQSVSRWLFSKHQQAADKEGKYHEIPELKQLKDCPAVGWGVWGVHEIRQCAPGSFQIFKGD